MTSDLMKAASSRGVVPLLGAVFTVGLLAAWNASTFAALTAENSVLGRGPLPHQLHERFLLLWAVLGIAWLVVLAFAVARRSWIQVAVALGALGGCVVAWFINASGWVSCIVQV